jgi:hypothetical protein
VDDKHVFAFIKAVNRAYLDAVCVFAVDAVLIDDICHLKILRRMRPVECCQSINLTERISVCSPDYGPEQGTTNPPIPSDQKPGSEALITRHKMSKIF